MTFAIVFSLVGLLFVLALSGWIARPIPKTGSGRWSLAAKVGLTIAAGLFMSVAGCFVVLGRINRGGGNAYALLLEVGLVVLGIGILWWVTAGLWFLSRKLFSNEIAQ